MIETSSGTDRNYLGKLENYAQEIVGEIVAGRESVDRLIKQRAKSKPRIPGGCNHTAHSINESIQYTVSKMFALRDELKRVYTHFPELKQQSIDEYFREI